jgi:hypothetical protein
MKVETITITIKCELKHKLNIENFEKLCEPNMSIEESDEFIINSIFEKYGFKIDKIISVDEV